MTIQLNDIVIQPSKSNREITKAWRIGPDLEFDNFELPDGKLVPISKNLLPYPHVVVPGVGLITGTATLFSSSISGGKSDALNDSNGFFINVMGRVVNYEDPNFKMKDLNQTVFAQLRVAIRADGLDKYISANRESISEGEELTNTRAFLKALFNLARREIQKYTLFQLNEASKVRKDSIRAIPLTTLSPLLEKAANDPSSLPAFIEPVTDLKESIEEWTTNTQKGESGCLENIEFEEAGPQNYLTKYDLKTRRIVINKNHPFAIEHSQTKEQRETLKDVALVDVMTDAYLASCGLSKDTCMDVIIFRDQSQRMIAQIRRRSASQIIETLKVWKDEAKPFEEIVGDALAYLGLHIERLAKPGEPEGIATAFITPGEEDQQSVYKLTFDAKSTKHSKVQTGNVHIAGLARHRNAFGAKYSLVVAPDFQEGALEEEATNNKVTPMTAPTLAKLISLSAGYGVISLAKLEEVFSLYRPGEVDQWVASLEGEMKKAFVVELPILINAMSQLTTEKKLDILSASAIAQKYREISGQDGKPGTTDIIKILQGLAIIAPTAIRVDPIRSDKVFLLTDTSMLLKELKRQVEHLPESMKVGTLSKLA